MDSKPKQNSFKTIKRQKIFREKCDSFESQLPERKQLKTNVFSGYVKNELKIKSLKDLCYERLIERIDNILDLNSMPYYVIKPVLEKCNSSQLSRIESLNGELIEESDELWFNLCENEFHFTDNNKDEKCYNNSIPNKTLGENWRQFYWRLIENRRKKLDQITYNINKKTDSVKNSQRMAKICEPNQKIPNHIRKIPEKKLKVAPLMRKCLLMRKQKQKLNSF